MPFDFATADGHDLAHAYATGQTDPVEAFEAALERLPVAEHAFIALTQGRGRREAEAARRRWLDHGPLSALDGVPIAWKDLFDMKGMVTTAGAAIRRHAETAPQDAALVSRLAQAGMVSLGKTNLSELAYSGLGLNPHFGTPVNPRFSAAPRAPGGSSSGSAIAVAAGVVPIAMGTDTAGSIRIPAAFNGLVGYRSSRKRYGFAGVFGLARSLDALGPITRSVRDAIALDQLFTHTHMNLDTADLRGLRLRVDEATLNDPRVQPAVRDNLEHCLQRLGSAGAHIDRRPLRAWQSALDCIAQQGWLGAAEAFASHERLLDSADAAGLDPRVRRRLEAARSMPASRQLRLYEQRGLLQAQLHSELDGALLITPTVAHVAHLLEPLQSDDELFASTNLATLRLTMPGSLLDMPGVTLPSGVDGDGLPTGLLLAACSGNDIAVLRAALAVETLLKQHP
ncbi:amidase [Pseudomonas sp. MWU16-30317]|uniref:amidase n=1 Tax=Pseudomonas sp. MWU16-30317 TaxID=2878095 RepID=UPI001CFBFFCD|nr:amidase [Pseudomonas sp. MWU16-30317]